MKPRLLAFALLCCLCSVAQKPSITGRVMDTTERRPLQYATVLLLTPKNNGLITFTRTAADGSFTLQAPDTGRFQLMVTFPKFADLTDEISVSENGLAIDLLALTPTGKLLQEVIVRGQGAIRIKGDTTEFTADSFVVRAGATVEDLLKRLPGFQVNSKGEITAQGKRVERVLVDGEEFFGNDPTMATQNLEAKQVDKVQLYEGTTDAQNLKGVTTGSEGKTLNIKLKDNAKKGAFGRVMAASDVQDYYDGKLLYNNFRGKRKAAVYGIGSNVNAGSLDWQDRQKLGMQEDMEFDEMGGYYFSNNQADEFNNWTLRGLPESFAGGALFSNRWDADKKGINLNYRLNRLRTFNEATTNTQNILPNNLSFRNINTTSTGLALQHAADVKYEWRIDSLASLKLTVNALHKINELDAETYSEFLNGKREFVNTNNQRRDGNTARAQTDNQLTYTQMFKKRNRKLISTLRLGYVEDDNETLNNNRITFYSSNVPVRDSVLNQLRRFDGQSTTLGTKHTYNEPITSKLNIVAEYAYNQNRSSSFWNTFNDNGTGKFEFLDTTFSNNFKVNASSNTGTLTLRKIDKKYKWSVGGGAALTTLRLNNLNTGLQNRYHFVNFMPQGNLVLTPKAQTNLSFGYRGNTVQPNVQQLQPIRNNDDPLREVRGNPALGVGFNHRLSLNYNQYKVLKGRGIWLGVNYNIVNNAITNFNLLDTTTGKQIFFPVNVNGNQNWNVWSNYSHGDGSNGFSWGVNFNANGGRNINFVNGLRNVTDFTSVNPGLRLGFNKKDKYDVYLQPRFGYNITRTSLNPDVNNNFFSFGGWLYATYHITKKLEINTNVESNNQQALAAFAGVGNVYINIWGANLTYKVMKKDAGRITLRANDILNQNKGFNRVVTSNFITEDRFLRVSRYVMLQFEWSFNKNPTSTN